MSLYQDLREHAPPVSVKNDPAVFPSPKLKSNREAETYLDAIDVILRHLPEDLQPRRDIERFKSDYRGQIIQAKANYDKEEVGCRQQRLELTKANVLRYLNGQVFAVPSEELWLKGGADVDLVDGVLRDLVASGQVIEEVDVCTDEGYENHKYRTYHTIKSGWDRVKRLFLVHSEEL